MRVLVINCGSSSLKFQVIEIGDDGKGRRLAQGLVDRIGDQATCTFVAGGDPPHEEEASIRDHTKAVKKVLSWLADQGGAMNFDAIGHRVVHGGERFPDSVLIDEEVMSAIEGFNDLAPLHNPACLSGIRAARSELGPSIPMAAVFDTSFHHTLPDYASTYAIPHEFSLHHRIRRYGFHGLAHRYAALRYGEMTGTPRDRVHIVTLHLGNGCSAGAIRNGRSIDTSMGFTPLEGLVMGTRSGDLDPAVVGYLARKEKVDVAEVEDWLNKRSGLLGLSGRSNDMRDLTERAERDKKAGLAVEVFCYRARKYLGAYLAVLGGAQAVVFSGGIGENSPLVRAKICGGMEWCGLSIDPSQNAALSGGEGRISSSDSHIHAYVIPSEEELVIARDTASLIRGQP